MNIYQLGKTSKTKELLKTLGVQSAGVSIISKKMELLYFYIKDLKTPAANILKQDALSIGAELAVPKGVITCEHEKYDCILIGNQKQLEILSQKELAQPFGLKELAGKLGSFLKQKDYPIRIMGVINANDDSFYDGSRWSNDEAVGKIEEMIEYGAEIIDIGAVSSRPGASSVDESVELDRVVPICDAVKSGKLYKKALFSIDSYTPSVVEYALKSGFGLINDITGASDDDIINLAVKYKAKLCIMHMQGKPKDMQANPHYNSVMIEIDSFFAKRIARCEELGLHREDIILDIGIGFGKSLEHNLELIKNLKHFRHFGCELLIGASRKSLIGQMTGADIPHRLAGTLAIHLKSIENGASILRCHDVAEHKEIVKIYSYIN